VRRRAGETEEDNGYTRRATAEIDHRMVALAGSFIAILLAVCGWLAVELWRGKAPVSSIDPIEDARHLEHLDGLMAGETKDRESADRVLTAAIAGIAGDVQSLQTQFTEVQNDMRAANSNALAARTAAEANTGLLREIKRKLP